MASSLVLNVARRLALLVVFTDNIENLYRMFTSIQAVLRDAETRRVKDEVVKIWLQNLKDVAYDVDDILDESMTEDILHERMTEALRSLKANGGDVSCFRFRITDFRHLLFRCKIGSRINKVMYRLYDIAEKKNQLGLRADIGEGERVDSELRRDENRERETSSQVNPPSVIGREDEKNEVLSLLLQEVTEVPLVISIVGMGGLGKTTLAQLIYNDEKLKEHFDLKMWVCVSEGFNVKKITKSIIESATKTGCKSLDLDLLQDRLCCLLQAKKFLLVLDDVWSKDSEEWEKLRLPFQAGAPGSRIIVTTRNEDVAGIMGSTDHMHKLAHLSDDDCWLLFRSKALKHRSAEECSELEEIGRQIVKKCGGVPLAAKTKASVMRSRRTRSQWELVLRSEMWNPGDVVEGNILPSLLLSYYDLPPVLKQCFAYLSIFPKDWELWKDMIVKLWVAQGFICSINGSCDMEEIGELYFDDLLRRSLLQNAVIGSDGSIVCCKMHDLVHDLAQYVAGSDCSVVEISKEASLNLKNVRHSFIVDNDEAGDEAHKLASISVPKLRTLLLKYSRISKVPDKLFHHSSCLRALDFSRTGIKKLPQTVGRLRHLRYLDLSQTDIEELPEELSNCINLQTLRLYWCRKLRKLPRGMREMISLRHLEFEDSDDLRYLPEGIGRLTELRTLTKFIVGGDDEGCKCGELKHLNYLQGSLRITGLQNVKSRDEASDAELHEKQHLHALSLEYDDEDVEPLDDDDEDGEPLDDDDEDGELLDDEVERMEDVLESLQPHTNLKELKIKKYKGSKLPRWIGDPIFSNLVKIKLQDCRQLKSLPEELGKLKALQALQISYCSQLESLPEELGKLKALQALQISYCSQLESLPEELGKLKALQALQISYCSQLESLPEELGQLKALQTLQIHDCPQLKSLPEELGQLKALQTLQIYDCPQLKSLPEELGQLKALQTLLIYDCPEELGQLKALQTLQIHDCLQLKSLPKELGQLKALQTLEISLCSQLESLPEELGQLKALQTLKISKCRHLKSLTEELGQLKALQTLEICDCSQLESLPEELGQLKALQFLWIWNCQQLGSLPEELGQLKALQSLWIWDCPLLKERCQDGGEDHHKIADIEYINIE